MVTTSEIAATATIWALTAVGLFFGIRALLKKARSAVRKQRRQSVNCQ